MHQDINQFTAALAENGVHFQYPIQGFASDAAPTLSTQANGGIPAYLATYIDPRQIDILFGPMKATEILGEAKRGDWTTASAQFPIVEMTGQVSSYGDYSNNGNATANANWEFRESYQFQVVTQWGELELERAGLARIDYAGRVNRASIFTLNKFQNKSYFYGIEGLKNYGILNDPSLLPAMTPAPDDAGNLTWANKESLDFYSDILKLFQKLQSQTQGLVDTDTPMKLCYSPNVAVYLHKTNQYNVNVLTQIKTNFPNIEFINAPEYATDAGEMVQMIVGELDGVEAGICGFTEKLRAHPVITEMSSWKQKKSAGSWGAVIFRPINFATIVGV